MKLTTTRTSLRARPLGSITHNTPFQGIRTTQNNSKKPADIASPDSPPSPPVSTQPTGVPNPTWSN